MPPTTTTMNAGNEDLDVHAGVQAEDRPRRSAADRGEADAEREYRREQQRHVDADPGRREGVVDTRADHGADAAALEEEPQTTRRTPVIE